MLTTHGHGDWRRVSEICGFFRFASFLGMFFGSSLKVFDGGCGLILRGLSMEEYGLVIGCLASGSRLRFWIICGSERHTVIQVLSKYQPAPVLNSSGPKVLPKHSSRPSHPSQFNRYDEKSSTEFLLIG